MTKRFYSGARQGGSQLGEAARLKRLEIEKGGKLPLSSTDRYKRIMQKKMEENRAKAAQQKSSTFQMPGAKPVERKMSKTTEQAMRLIAQRKAMKEEKELRQMVVVTPRIFSDCGRIDKKGNAYDLGNNLTLKVDLKTGKIKTTTGWTVGKYNNRKKYLTNALIQDSLKKHGPYFIQQKRLQMLQQQAELAKQYETGANAWGAIDSDTGGSMSASELYLQKHYGLVDEYGRPTPAMHNRGSGVTAWGAMSNNVMGVHAENVWGGMVDNVWGGTDSNIWGGLGGNAWGEGGVWGSGRQSVHHGWSSRGIFGGGGLVNWNKRGLKIWGSGKEGQKNFLRPLAALFAGVPIIGKLVSRGRVGRSG